MFLCVFQSHFEPRSDSRLRFGDRLVGDFRRHKEYRSLVKIFFTRFECSFVNIFFTRLECSFVNIFLTRFECSFLNIFFTRFECSFVNIFFTRLECSFVKKSHENRIKHTLVIHVHCLKKLQSNRPHFCRICLSRVPHSRAVLNRKNYEFWRTKRFHIFKHGFGFFKIHSKFFQTKK